MKRSTLILTTLLLLQACKDDEKTPDQGWFDGMVSEHEVAFSFFAHF